MNRQVLLTGAAGRIGSFLTAHLAHRYDFVLSDRRKPVDPHRFPFIKAEFTDLEAVRTLCCNIDTVEHLAADPDTDAP